MARWLLPLLLAACTSAPVVLPTPTPTREPGVLQVSVLLDLSGSRAPSGQAQRNAMQLWVDQAPQSPLKLRVTFVDVAGSDTKLLLELKRAIVDDRADAVVVGVPMPAEGPLMDAIALGATPVLLTLPISDPVGASGGFAFALAPAPIQVANAIASDLVDRSLLQPMLLAGDDSPPSVGERGSFVAELRRRGITPPGAVSLAAPDAAQRVRAAAAFAKSVVLTGASAPYGDVVRSIPVAIGAPVVYLSYLTETADVTNLRDQSALVTWPGSRVLASSASTTTAPPFVQRFTDRYGAPSTLAATGYDALALVFDAASSVPGDTGGARLRQRLEATTFPGVVTRYSFTATRHLGFATPDLALLRWNSQTARAFVPAPPGDTER